VIDAATSLQEIVPSLSPLQAARIYHARGWAPIPIPLGVKNPGFPGWQKLRLTADDLPKHFLEPSSDDDGPDGQNIGLLLGDPSNGLTDVDLDSPETVALAARFLPPTGAIFGRRSKPRSHWLYRTEPTATTAKFKAPDGEMLVELRSTGCQTVVPPSIHAELVRWDETGEPTTIDAEELRRATARLAAAALLVRSWPAEGSRHEAALALGGGLLRGGWSEDEAADFIEVVADAAGDEEAEARARDVRSTAQRLDRDQTATGLPRLAEIIGQAVVDRVRAWLGLRTMAPVFIDDLADGTEHPHQSGGARAHGGRFRRTDLGNAERLVARHGRVLRYCQASKKWLVFDGRRWRMDAVADVYRLAKDTVRHIYAEASGVASEEERKQITKWAVRSEAEPRIKAMLGLAEKEVGIPVTPEELDADPWLLNVANGTLDLRTGALREHRPEDLITRLAPVTYDPDATCPTWQRFLQRIMGGKQTLIDFLQRAVGYSLTGSVREQVLFLMYGTGANGKSTFLDALQALLADSALQADFSTFLMTEREGVRNDLARLRGARLVSAVEAEAGRRLSEVVLKQLTGGDRITARFLYGEFFEFTPSFKLWLAANHKPMIRGQDPGIWRRIRLIPFTETIPKEEQDRELPEKLRAELPGILAWAVQGCLAWQRDGLGEPEEVREATAEYRTEMDILGDFIAAHAEVDASATVEASILYRQYAAWAEGNGDKPMTKTMFGCRLSERGFRPCKVGKASARGWGGLRLTSQAAGRDSGDGSPGGAAVADAFGQADTFDGDFGKVPYSASIPLTSPKNRENVSADENLSANGAVNDRTDRPLPAHELTDSVWQPHAAPHQEEIREWRS